jgi:hypothetical protein
VRDIPHMFAPYGVYRCFKIILDLVTGEVVLGVHSNAMQGRCFGLSLWPQRQEQGWMVTDKNLQHKQSQSRKVCRQRLHSSCGIKLHSTPNNCP